MFFEYLTSKANFSFGSTISTSGSFRKFTSSSCFAWLKAIVWAFNPSFLASHAKDGVEEDVFKSLSELCESSNDAVLSLIDDFDDFVGDAISSDGRGHFISQYDGEESIEEINGTEYFIYRTN